MSSSRDLSEFCKEYSNDLGLFVRKCISTASSNPYVHNWHIDLISEYLLACQRGEIKRLIINAPPRFSKSLIVSVAFVAWVLGHEPTKRFLCFSHKMELALELSKYRRVIMTANWYQKLMPKNVLLDQTQEKCFNTAGGGYRALPAGSGSTGFGADFILIDDPQTGATVNSDKERSRIIRWYETEVITRLNNRKEGVIILVQQRLHPEDLTGFLEKTGVWEKLVIPIQAKSRIKYDFGSVKKIMYEDEYLCEERVGPKEALSLYKEMGPMAYESQCQQNPVYTGDCTFKADWLRYYEPQDLPPFSQMNLLMPIDIAGASDSAENKYRDYSVMLCLGLRRTEAGQMLYLIDAFVDKLNAEKLKNAVQDMIWRYAAKMPKERPPKPTIEKDGEWLAQIAEQELVRKGCNVKIRKLKSKGPVLSKEERISLLVPAFERGEIFFPRSMRRMLANGDQVDIIEMLRDQFLYYQAHVKGGGVAHDDILDALAQPYAYLNIDDEFPQLNNGSIVRLSRPVLPNNSNYFI